MSSQAVVRGTNGQEITLNVTLPIPYWSTAEFGADVDPKLDLFGYVEGDTVPSAGTVPAPGRQATKSDTNITSPGMLDDNQEFDVWSVSYEITSLSGGTPTGAVLPENVWRLCRDFVITLNTTALNTKAQVRYPLSQLAQASGPSFLGALGAVGANVAPPIGFGAETNPFASPLFRIPVHIAGRQQYSVSVNSERSPKNDTLNPRHSQAIQIKVFLIGLSTRPGTAMGTAYYG